MSKAFDCAIRLLSRREHGADELLVKLHQKGFDADEATAALAESQRLGYQDDARFAESLCRARINQGYGPLKIKQELQAKRLDKSLIQEVLAQQKDHWAEHARRAWQKKFRSSDKPDYPEMQKQQRFLAYRGFPMDIISSLFRVIDD